LDLTGFINNLDLALSQVFSSFKITLSKIPQTVIYLIVNYFNLQP